MFFKTSLLLALSLFSVASFSQNKEKIYDWKQNSYISEQDAFYTIATETGAIYGDGDDGVTCKDFEIFEPEVKAFEYAEDTLKVIYVNYTVYRSCWPEKWACSGKFTFNDSSKFEFDCKFVD